MRRSGLQLFRRRHDRGAARPRTGHGYRDQAGPPGPRRLFLPGGRRPRRHRHRGEFSRSQPGRKHHGHLHQQRRLRHDRRADGPDLHAGTEDHDLAGREGIALGRPSRSRSPRSLPCFRERPTSNGARSTPRPPSSRRRNRSARPSSTRSTAAVFRWSRSSPPVRRTGR